MENTYRTTKTCKTGKVELLKNAFSTNHINLQKEKITTERHLSKYASSDDTNLLVLGEIVGFEVHSRRKRRREYLILSMKTHNKNSNSKHTIQTTQVGENQPE